MNEAPLFTQFYAPFFMPVFFFVSGYLYKYSGVKDNFRRICRTLLWPYVAFSYIANCCAPVFIRNIQDGEVIEYLCGVTHRLLLGKTFWFIACLIIVQIIYTVLSYIFSKQKNKIWKIVVAVIGMLCIYVVRRDEPAYLPWHIDTACFTISFFALGDLFKYINIKNISENKRWRYVSWCVLALYIATTVYFNWGRYGIDIDVNCNIYNNTTLSLFLIIFGCISLILFSLCNNCGNFVSRLGANTLVIYCLHGGFGLGISSAIFNRLQILEWCQSPYIHTLLVACLAGIIMLIIAYIINNYFAFLLGKTRKINRTQCPINKSN